MLKPVTIGLLTLTAACASAAFAHDVQFRDTSFNHHSVDKTEHSLLPAPEIDPASAMGALTLLAGGLAVIRGRRGRDRPE